LPECFHCISASFHHLVELFATQPASHYHKQQRDYKNNASELHIKDTSVYTVEHDFFGTAKWRNLFLVSHGGYMVTQCL